MLQLITHNIKLYYHRLYKSSIIVLGIFYLKEYTYL